MNDVSKKFSHLGKPVQTKDGSFSLIHPEHGECYHSESGASMEARSLYITGSGIEQQFQLENDSSINVLDVGLGLAYNAIATFRAWHDSSGLRDLVIVSLELNNDLICSLVTGKAPWQVNWQADELDLCCTIKPVSNGWYGEFRHHKTDKTLKWYILVGDARTMDLGHHHFSYIWQDPFSPAKNPTMWSVEWFETVKDHSLPGAILMTYSVSRIVKDSLTSAGWQWQRFEASGNKRNWMRAVNPIDS